MILHQPWGHHDARNEPGVAEAETFCCMASSGLFPSITLKVFVRVVLGCSVAKPFEIDFGAALVPLKVVVRRIVEQDCRASDESVVERL